MVYKKKSALKALINKEQKSLGIFIDTFIIIL